MTRSIVPATFFVVRSPLLPFDAPLAAAREDAVVREALRLASPSLLLALDGERRSRQDPTAATNRYIERMRGRATPFSLLAGYAVGAVGGSETRIDLAPRERYRHIVRLDIDCVTRLVAKAANESPRSSAWRARADLAWFEDLVRVATRSESGNDVTYVDVARSEALEAVLHAARSPRSLDELEAVARKFGDEQQAVEFTAALRHHGLIVPAGSPAILGRDELVGLEGFPELVAVARELRDTAVVEPVTDRMAALERGAGLRADDLIHDLVKPVRTAALGEDVLWACRAVIEVLRRISRRAADPRLATFRAQFRARFEGRSVPLVEVLDPQRGLEFGVKPTRTVVFDELDAWKVRVFERACHAGGDLVLRDEDLPTNTLWELPAAFAMTFGLSSGPMSLWRPSLGSPTGAFARSTAFLPELHEATVAYLQDVSRLSPDVDHADVSFFIPGRSAAYTQYPLLTPHELALAAVASPGAQLDADDLRVEVEEDIRIVSAKTGRRVRIVRTGAVNPDRDVTTPLYRFLYALAAEEDVRAGWSWGPLGAALHTPRVRYGDHVLAPAEWNLDARHTAALRTAKGRIAQADAVENLRRELGLPRRLGYHETHDHVLPVDLDDPDSVEAWLDVAHERMHLIEPFPAERSAVCGPEGRFVHEIVVPFSAQKASPRRTTGSANTTAALPARAFPRPPLDVVFDRVAPGGDALFLTFSGDTDELLGTLIPLVQDVVRPALAARELTHWFFLPYSHPDGQVRLRLFGAADMLWRYEFLRLLCQPLQALVRARVLRDVSFETYDRETYRYGGPVGMDLAERVFWASSEIALDLHSSTSFAVDRAGAEGVLVPLVGSLRAILDATGLSLEGQRDVADRASALYFRGDESAAPKRWAGELHRKVRELHAMAPPEQICGSEPLALLQGTMKALREGCDAGGVARPLADLAIDFLHVHAIRLLTTWSEVPELETASYHLLHKVIASDLARKVHWRAGVGGSSPGI